MLSSTSKPYRTRYFRRPYPRVLFYTWELTCGLFYIDVLCNKHTGSLGVLVTVHPPHQPRTEGVQPQSEMYGAPPCCPCARCFARVGSLLSRHLAGVGRLGARCWRKKIAIALLRYFSLSPQQVDLWVRVGGTPSPHIHTYIHITGLGRPMVYTAADPEFACPRFFLMKGHESVIFCLRRARP